MYRIVFRLQHTRFSYTLSEYVKTQISCQLDSSTRCRILSYDSNRLSDIDRLPTGGLEHYIPAKLCVWPLCSARRYGYQELP